MTPKEGENCGGIFGKVMSSNMQNRKVFDHTNTKQSNIYQTPKFLSFGKMNGSNNSKYNVVN